MTRQPLWVILCRLPEKKATKGTEKLADERKERETDEEKRNSKWQCRKHSKIPLSIHVLPVQQVLTTAISPSP